MEYSAAVRRSESVIASEASDVRFLLVATLPEEVQRADPALSGHVLLASGRSVEDVAARLLATRIPQDVAAGPPAGLAEADLPSAFRLAQVISPYTGPLFRVQGIAGAASVPAPQLSAAGAVAQVRGSGIRALGIDVPSQGPATRIAVLVYSTTGRLVRRLVDEALVPGRYVVGWDGQDEAGRPVPPGVYIAVMTAGTYRATQRLIIK
jgi:hypothetical protein